MRIILPNSRRMQIFAVFEANCTVGQLYEFTVPDAPVIYWLQSGSPLDILEHSICETFAFHVIPDVEAVVKVNVVAVVERPCST